MASASTLGGGGLGGVGFDCVSANTPSEDLGWNGPTHRLNGLSSSSLEPSLKRDSLFRGSQWPFAAPRARAVLGPHGGRTHSCWRGPCFPWPASLSSTHSYQLLSAPCLLHKPGTEKPEASEDEGRGPQHRNIMPEGQGAGGSSVNHSGKGQCKSVQAGFSNQGLGSA